jgi:hypothetical protein
MTAWSYSSLGTFKQCPKKYYHLKVAKDFKDSENSASLYGKEVHTAAELYMKNDTPIPKKFSFMVPIVESLKNIGGDKLCEVKLAVAKGPDGYAPTTFFATDVWWRGVADLVILDGDIAYSVDYKTGKNAKYADTTQLDAVAAGLFTHYPELKTIKSALAYVISKEFITKEHTVDKCNEYFETFHPALDRLAVAEDTGVWNAVSGPLCGWCPVTSCEHHRRR